MQHFSENYWKKRFPAGKRANGPKKGEWVNGQTTSNARRRVRAKLQIWNRGPGSPGHARGVGGCLRQSRQGTVNSSAAVPLCRHRPLKPILRSVHTFWWSVESNHRRSKDVRQLSRLEVPHLHASSEHLVRLMNREGHKVLCQWRMYQSIFCLSGLCVFSFQVSHRIGRFLVFSQEFLGCSHASVIFMIAGSLLRESSIEHTVRNESIDGFHWYSMLSIGLNFLSWLECWWTECPEWYVAKLVGSWILGKDMCRKYAWLNPSPSG